MFCWLKNINDMFYSLYSIVTIWKTFVLHIVTSNSIEFTFYYDLSTLVCGGTFYATDHEERFSTPNYPANYPPDITCTWTIISNSSSGVQLTFLDFIVEFESGCEDDYVKIFAESELLAFFCGDGAFHRFDDKPYRASKKLTVLFRTNGRIEKKGFLAAYTNGNAYIRWTKSRYKVKSICSLFD